MIDDISSSQPESLEFIAKIMDFNIVNVLVTIPNNHINIGAENLSKICSNTFEPFELDKVFERPSDDMIKGLYRCYDCSFDEKYLNVFNRYERNIHIIMSYIRGFHMDFMRLDKNSILLLKIMLILNTSIYIKTLNAIYNKSLHLSSNMDDSNFKIFINTLINRGFLGIDQYDYIHLNHNIISEDEIKITLVERLTISRDIIDIFERCKTELTISQLKFAIHNLDKDYSRRKSYILVLLKKRK